MISDSFQCCRLKAERQSFKAKRQTNVAELVFALCSTADVTDGPNVQLFKAKLIVTHSDSVSVNVKLQRWHDSCITPNDTSPMPHRYLSC